MLHAKAKIGIMGGTFDPIHVGHLVTAEAVRIEYNLEKVLFIPASNPPHKQDSLVTPAIHRYIMTIMATYSNRHFFVSGIELERSGLSYTIDTVKDLIECYGASTEFYFITGADAVKDLPSWQEIDQLLDLCYFVAAARPGCISYIDQVIKQFGAKGRRSIQRLATPELEISSTDIRERVRKGRSIKYIVPESVEDYIYKEGLYR
ncbi:putative nicotinate-nucleotide adenylyltransferase [Sporomusa ovata DSM 2662]|jgi:nicotinate-nucleotide adenylyltransferase|uniref:Probable nicotinate-nucleotide adenylyltransferase n=2 Tax=Sporomusa TaxID=2375 RepID=A0A0U1KYP2_9FIRM|nr:MULTISPECIES: nicotinate-nucleotide adenylyltransferase [Sporomusa]EQB29109.1 nicotinate-nucleotide adenylyltransferase [Sporomusa ovata DSM 2662]OZC18715.1 putative nicotinate-nucleotide adenylyltransferase [Sporomusa silvacetica DSM 10669]TWH48234.1 nicotinate-nucleotide adenylyltransferase [Sporomusa sp. KB1]CQR72541.1 Nicotinate-nucleotide adenylyltransferase [Sporomusa ovata]